MFPSKNSHFEELVRAYSAELYRYAYWLCRERFGAEDLVQETFARAWRNLSALRDEHTAKGWLYTILRNEHARLFERKRVPIEDDHDLDSLIDQRLGSASDAFELRQVLHALPEVYREPLLLQVLGGFSCEEIATMMQLSTGAVMTRLSRARLSLRKQASLAGGREAMG